MKVIMVLAILVILKLSCTSKHQIENYDLSPVITNSIGDLNNLDSLISVDLCSAIPFKWDRLVVLPPYAVEGMLEKVNLININELAEGPPYLSGNRFPQLTIDDRACVLLFVEKNRILSYSHVGRALLDFTDLVKDNELIKSIAREDFCNKLYLVKRSDTLNSASAYKIVIDQK